MLLQLRGDNEFTSLLPRKIHLHSTIELDGVSEERRENDQSGKEGDYKHVDNGIFHDLGRFLAWEFDKEQEDEQSIGAGVFVSWRTVEDESVSMGEARLERKCKYTEEAELRLLT